MYIFMDIYICIYNMKINILGRLLNFRNFIDQIYIRENIFR